MFLMSKPVPSAEPAGPRLVLVDGKSEDRAGSPGVHAALSMLEALVRRGALGLTELAGEVGVAKSTVHRITAVLVRRGWAIRRRDGRFDLGIRAIGISSSSAELPLITAFRSTAAALLDLHNETVCLAVVDGDDSVYIALEETSHAVRLVTHVGSRTPAYASASGRVVLSDRPDSAVAAQFTGRILESPTGSRLDGIDALLAIVRAVRTIGYAHNDEETAVGLDSLSAPIRNARGRVLAALTLCIPSSRLGRDRFDVMTADLIDAAARLSADISWLPEWNATRADR